MNSLKDTNYLNLLKMKQITSNSSICIKYIEFIVINFPTKKTLVPDGFTGQYYQTFKKNDIKSQSFLDNGSRGKVFPASIILILKPDEDIVSNYKTSIFHEHRYHNKNLANIL